MSAKFFQKQSPTFPHREIPLWACLVVEDAVRAAWRMLVDEGKLNLIDAHEDAITFALYELLYDKVLNKGIVAGFDSRIFQVGTRESKVANFDSSSPDLMPDLLITLVGREEYKPSQDWLFAECKPVDLKHPVGEHYGGLGIARFIRGDYAWAMPNAMMIAYSVVKYPLRKKLAKALEKYAVPLGLLKPPSICSSSEELKWSPSVEQTTHSRAFSYVHNRSPAPPIILRHLWLSRD
jgi:hypothetical protein